MRLVEKHPEPTSVTEDSILEGPILKIHLTASAEIDSSLELYERIMDKILENLWL